LSLGGGTLAPPPSSLMELRYVERPVGGAVPSHKWRPLMRRSSVMVEASPGRPAESEPAADGEVDVAPRLRLAIGRIGRRLRIEGGGGPTPSQTSALYTLGKEGPLRIGDLASRERVTAPTTTRVVAALEQSGLVVRTADPDDGRSWLIELTTAGQDLIDTLTRDHTAYLAAHVAGLTADEREALVAALPVLEQLAADVR